MRINRIFSALIILAGLCNAADLVPVPSLGLRVARGFRVTLYADADLAHDITAMTIDPHGNVVVSGPGYIRTLLDPTGQRRATLARDFAPSTAGGQGLCFDGNYLYFAGDGMLARFVDADGNGIADGPPERLLTLNTAGPGGNAVRKGPDGAIYLLAGNEMLMPAQNPLSPIKTIQAGALFRLVPGGLALEPIAHGFRNPCDFDFNWAGDLFTCDKEVEGDLFLPWYTPARLFHVAHSGNHGCRLARSQRTWSHPDAYPDTVSALAQLGPELITGVASYTHSQFPARYRAGLFVCDWAFGRVYFLPLQPAGASYQTAVELFLEPIGVNGFAPSDLAVAPDGALLVSTGGRKTRGSVYRVEYAPAANTAELASNWWVNAVTEVEAVLAAPQPLEAWSRAWWEPVALRLGPLPFAGIVADQNFLPAYRARSVEVLTELHGGLPEEAAAAGAQANSPLVRARVAWSLGCIPPPNFSPLILQLAKDADPGVRRCALESALRQSSRIELAVLQQILAANLAHPDKRIRQCAARLAALLPEPAWQALWAQVQRGAAPQAQLTAILALLWRSPQGIVNQQVIETAQNLLAQTRLPDFRLQALGLIVLGLGGYHFEAPSLEAYTAYETPLPLAGREALVSRLCAQLRAIFPSGVLLVDWEAARLLAMLEDDDPSASAKVLSMLAESSSPSADFHYLTVLSRLTGPMPTNTAPLIAHALVSLDRKLAGRENDPQLHWSMRLVEITRNLLQRSATLRNTLLREPGFASPAHVDLVPLLEGENYLKAARLFAAAMRQNPAAAWPDSLLQLLEALPEEESTPLFRQLWTKPAWRDRLTLKLAVAPEELDRDKFLASLLSDQPQVCLASLKALRKMPRDGSERGLALGAHLLFRLCQQPAESASRVEALAFLNREASQSFTIQETGAQPEQLLRAYQPVFRWFAAKNPASWKNMLAEGSDDPANWNQLLRQVPWERGDPGRGEVIFREQGCQNCHSTPSRLGPALSGITQRLTLTNLFYALAYPSRQVAAPYRTTTFQMRGGQSFTGLMAFESPEVVLLHTGSTTVRLYTPEIISREPSKLSIMPSGLLKGLKVLSLADFYSYLQTLPPAAR